MLERQTYVWLQEAVKADYYTHEIAWKVTFTIDLQQQINEQHVHYQGTGLGKYIGKKYTVMVPKTNKTAFYVFYVFSVKCLKISHALLELT